MVGLCSLALWCTGQVTLNFSGAAIRWVYGGCDVVSHSVQGMLIINCLIPPYSVNGRFMLSFLR